MALWYAQGFRVHQCGPVLAAQGQSFMSEDGNPLMASLGWHGFLHLSETGPVFLLSHPGLVAAFIGNAISSYTQNSFLPYVCHIESLFLPYLVHFFVISLCEQAGFPCMKKKIIIGNTYWLYTVSVAVTFYIITLTTISQGRFLILWSYGWWNWGRQKRQILCEVKEYQNGWTVIQKWASHLHSLFINCSLN